LTPEEHKAIDKFVDEVIMTADHPILKASKIIHEFYQSKIAKLEKEIEELKKENIKLKGDI